MKYILVLMMLFSTNLTHAEILGHEYPLAPIPQLTPGELCSYPTEYRYQENIPYCERDVAYELKEQVFNEYRRAGFVIPANERSNYKIDHFIPLCAGGANTFENLWPQHKTIYEITDSLEVLACEKLKQGKITQRNVVALIKKAKMNLSQVRSVRDQLARLR
ncbi:MAG: hypothetical protein ACOVP4_08940 [Bacteriovoracaceae bacterium]